MGYVKHGAVLVTVSGYVTELPDVDKFRESLPEQWRRLVIGPVQAIANGDWNYAFLADGSKEGWSDSDDGDRYREDFAGLFLGAYEDGSSPYDVAIISYGGDEPEQTSAYRPRMRWGQL